MGLCPSANASPPGTEAQPVTASERLHALLKQDFQFLLRDNPEFASESGIHEYDGELQDLSPQSFENRQAHCKEVADLVKELLSEGGLSPQERKHAELLLSAVEIESKAIDLGLHLMPLNSVGVGCVYENIQELLQWMNFEDKEDAQKYIGRLIAFPKQVESVCNLLTYGAGKRGIVASESMMRKVPERLEQLLKSDLHELRAPLEGKTFMNDEIRESLSQAIENGFKKGIKRLLDFIREFYTDHVRKEPGLNALKWGPEMYALCLRFHTTTSKGAKEIHELGLKEVSRIEGRMQKEVLAPLGFKGSVKDFAESLKADKSLFCKTEEELLAGYKDLVASISEKLPKYFKRVQKAKLEVVRKEGGPPAYYFAGLPDGKRPGLFYVNVSRVTERPKYEMQSLALHEGVPGHHTQISMTMENNTLPDMLRYLEDRRYEFGPARRSFYTGFIEGWAVYCERLGEEMGMYATPQQLYGRLSWEMVRAVRLVVDTGIHDLGWSVERASTYMQDKTGMTAAACSEECHRYAAWPGQATAYKVGEIAIEEMKSKAEKVLGDKFDLLSFHELLLADGPCPLDLMESRVDKWIEASKR